MTSYHGGKKRIGKQIYEVIKKFDDEKMPYFEPFCGMCGVLVHFAKENNDRIIVASDINKDIILMWKAVQKGWKPPTTCNKECYLTLKHSKKHSALRGFFGSVCSFSGMFFRGGYRAVSDSQNFIIGGIKGLQKAMQFMKNVIFKYKSYDDYNPKGFLIYCDPPYKYNKIANETFENFDHKKFWDVMRKWSKDNIVIISEKTAPKDFACIWEKKYNICFLNTGNLQNETKSYTEKLFIYNNSFNL